MTTFQLSLDEAMTEERATMKFLSGEQLKWFAPLILFELRVSMTDIANANFWNNFFAVSHLVKWGEGD